MSSKQIKYTATVSQKDDILCLETVQDHASGVADFLVHQKGLDVCSLVSRKLNDFPYFLVLLDGTVATEILLECLANSLNVEIVGQAGDSRDTLASVSLLDTDVNLFFGVSSGVVSGVLKGVCKIENNKQIRK